MGARGVLPALGAPATGRAGGEGTRDGIGSAERGWPAARPHQKKKTKKKNDGSTEAQKARGETPARPPTGRGPPGPISLPARVRSGSPPRAAERGGPSGRLPSGNAYRAGGAVRLRL